MSDFRDHLARELQNPDFKGERDSQKPKREEACGIVGAQLAEGMCQEEFAENAGKL